MKLVSRYCHDLLTATGGVQAKAGAGAVADHTSALNLLTTSSAGNIQMIFYGGEGRRLESDTEVEGVGQEKNAKAGDEEVQEDIGGVSSDGGETTGLNKADYYRPKFIFTEVIPSASRGGLCMNHPNMITPSANFTM